MGWFSNFMSRFSRVQTELGKAQTQVAEVAAAAQVIHDVGAAIPAVVHTITPSASLPSPPTAKLEQFPRLKWVMFRGRIGIVSGFTPGGDVVVDLVDENGYTVGSEISPQGNDIRIAKLAEIPAPRRPDEAKGASLGYF